MSSSWEAVLSQQLVRASTGVHACSLFGMEETSVHLAESLVTCLGWLCGSLYI